MPSPMGPGSLAISVGTHGGIAATTPRVSASAVTMGRGWTWDTSMVGNPRPLPHSRGEGV
jgi:hypothetical protein